jgi:hypothetical protein
VAFAGIYAATISMRGNFMRMPIFSLPGRMYFRWSQPFMMLRSNSLGFLRSLIVGLLIISNSSSVSGKNLPVLTRMLYAAFLSEQMSAICTNAHIKLSEADRNAFLSAKIYSEGIKQKIIAGLNDADANSILKAAADRARADTRSEIATLTVYPPEEIPGATIRWCENKVKPFVSQIVGAYARHPDVIEKLINKAKAD